MKLPLKRLLVRFPLHDNECNGTCFIDAPAKNSKQGY